MTESAQVWEAMMDDRYRVTVTRTAEYRGRLRIVDTNGDDLVHEEEVRLSYGAIFGPDVADISRWQEIAMEAVDGRQGA